MLLRPQMAQPRSIHGAAPAPKRVNRLTSYSLGPVKRFTLDSKDL